MTKILITLFIFTPLIAPINSLHAGADRHPWFFTAKEIATAYRYQQTFGKGLHRPLKARSCMYGAKQFTASYYNGIVQLPCRFVTESLRHLRAILKSGAARYLFPLDLDHAHLAIPKPSWENKYRRLPSEKILPAMLHDPALVALYHSAEHLAITDFNTGTVNPTAKAWREKRNILAFYDGRPIVILPPHPDGQGASVPEAYFGYGGFDFLANPYGHLAVLLDNDAVSIDMTLQIGGAGSPSP